MADSVEPFAELSPERARLLALTLKRELEDRDARDTEPIAITGMSCRFPKAPSLDAFWALLERGGDAITEVPAERFDVDRYYDPDPDAPGKMYVREGGFIDDVFDFDPAFFGIAPREAVSMDPQQRLLLELSWEALEDAGEATERLAGRAVGVFVGHSTNDYARRSFGREIDAYSGTGSATSIAAGRISYVLGLTGPNLPVDTACSSSLVALHLACQSLKARECELALAAGVNLILAPEPTVYFCKMRALAPDGRCKTFDALANGYVRGEGCGVIVLKRLSDALAGGDRIHAVVRGSAVNQDGRTTGLTVPNRFAQEKLLRRALAVSRASPSEVDYLEAHGTGTPLGDPIELQAIAAVHAERTQPLLVGSVKTNVGHLEAAAGIAGVIKTVLALQKGSIPPHLHFHQPNPYVPWSRLPLTVSPQLMPWPSNGGRPRLAGVSSFGFSGTNAHVVIEQAPAPAPRRSAYERPLHILGLGAKDDGALAALASRMAERIEGDNGSLADVFHSANAGRSHFASRLALVAGDAAEAGTALRAFASGTPHAAIRAAAARRTEPPGVVFLFTGQGSQYVQMGRELYDTLPAFRRTLDQCAEVLAPCLPRPLLDVMHPGKGAPSPLDDTAFSQPALFALEYALGRVWQGFGVEPSYGVGHSVGELAAACLAGAFSLEDGLRLAAERGRLMQALPALGTMASVRAGGEAVEAVLKDLGLDISIAAFNGPSSTVVSGPREAVADALAEMARRGLRSQALTVSHAFHSALMDPILDDLERVAGGIAYAPPGFGIVSGVSGDLASGEDLVTAGYWRRHAREPVQFGKAMSGLDERGCSVFLEIGPQPVLSALARSCVREAGQIWLPSLRRGTGEWAQMLQSLRELYLQGIAVDWRGFDEGYDRRRVTVPTYPFQRSRYVLEATELDRPPAPVPAAPPAEEKDRPEEWLYGVAWRPARPGKASPPPQAGKWLLLADRAGVALRLAEQIGAKGGACVLVEPGASFAFGEDRGRIRPEDPGDFKRLLAALDEAGKEPLAGIVHAWSLDAAEPDHLDLAALRQASVRGTASALHLIQAIAFQRGQSPPPVWLVTRGVHRIRETDPAPGLAQAPLWGMARGVAIEYPNLRCTRVDLDPCHESHDGPGSDAAAILSLLGGSDGEDQVALRGGERYVTRLERARPEKAASAEIVGSGTYLITGGLGGIGLPLARWLAGRGARHIALVGRREPSETAREEVARLRDAGVEVAVRQADVGDPEQVAALFEHLSRTMPPLRGVVHAAGTLEDGALQNQDWARFETVLRPKVDGAWNIHVQSLAIPLDFLVLYSSIASLLGAPGQANYCAGNAFLDALAHHRRGRGLPATSINWGPWAGSGMAARQQPAALRAWQTLGIGLLPPAEALESLGGLLASPAPQVGVIRAEWSKLLSLFPQGLEPPFLRDLVKGKRRARPASGEWAALVKQVERATEEEAGRAMRAFVGRLVAEALGRPAADPVDADTGFFDLGMDSLMTMDLAARLRANLGDSHLVPASFLFDHPTVDSVSRYLLAEVIGARAAPAAVSSPAVASRGATAGIAIVGYACRFPGAANGPAFWDLLCQGRDAIRPVPPERWDVDRYYDADPKAPGKMYVRDGGFLEEIEAFDAQFFGISPREAVKMDPQQRLLLETAWRALEDASQRADRLKGSRTAVFFGISGNDYLRAIGETADFADVDAYLATGNALSIAAGRVSHVFGFEGPCLAVDTACSSSLVAVHLACESLRGGKARLALAGGVNVILAPEINVSLCKIGALAPDGRCKTFDAAANGYVRSEGCGIVVLKRLEDALADGDPIRAVILSSAINHDGRSSGVTVPNGAAQVALLRAALAEADVRAGDVGYVEAHGTGTPLGDPIEMHSIAAVYGEERPSDRPLLVGSVKTNVGHLEAAAGVAGLIKVVESLAHGAIPPHLHFRQPSPHIEWSRAPVRIPTRLEPWPGGGRRVAAVSSFGFSGTNAHCVVAGPPPAAPEAPVGRAERPAHALALSARSEEALLAHARDVAAHLAVAGEAGLPDTLFSLNAGRSQFSKRLFVAAASAAEARAELEAVAGGGAGRRARISNGASGAPRVAFLFTGQGSQYAGMGRRLFETQPTFRRAVEEGAAALDGAVGRPLASVLYATEGETEIDETLYAHPALYVLQCALVRLWQSWGVRPAVVLGHSIGECAAAWAAGVFSFEAGLKLVAERARLIQASRVDGGMLAIAAGEATAAELVRAHDGRVAVAAVNSPRRTVISGSRDSLAAIADECARRGIAGRPVRVGHPFHSPVLQALGDDLMRAAREVEYREPQVPIVSAVSGRLASDGELSNPEYWARQLLAPVRFRDGVRALDSADAQVFLEIGPEPTLVTLGKETLEGTPRDAWIHSLRRGGDDWQEMIGALGQLYVRGVDVDWKGFDGDYGRRWVAVPGYPFQKQRFWPERSARALAAPSRGAAVPPAGPVYDDTLLGRRLHSPALADVVFENRFSAEHPPFLSDHRVYSMLVVPGAAHLAMLTAAAGHVGIEGAIELRDVTFPEGMILAEGESRLVQLILSAEQDGAHPFRILSAREGGEPSWIVNSTGSLVRDRIDAEARGEAGETLAEIQHRCGDHLTNTKMFYRLLVQQGIELGTNFQWIDEIWRRPGEALARLRAATPDDRLDLYPVHPGWIDACFQLLTVALTRLEPGFATYLPIGVGRFLFYRRPESSPWIQVTLRPKKDDDPTSFESDIRMLTESGEPIALIDRFRVRRAPRESFSRFAQRRVTDSLYSLQWVAADGSVAPREGSLGGTWLILDGAEGNGDELVRLIEAEGGTGLRVEPGACLEALGDRGYRADLAGPEGFRELLRHLGERSLPELRGIVHLWAAEGADRTPDAAAALEDQLAGARSVLSVVKALGSSRFRSAPRVWLVTRGVQPVPGRAGGVHPTHAPLWGLGRVIALEQPRLRCTRIDLDPATPARDWARILFRELGAPDGEDQIAYGGETRHVARLARYRVSASASDEELSLPASGPYRLVRSAQGSLNDISAEVVARRPPGHGEVEIRVRAAGLNFRDVLNALGLYPGNAGGLGWEAAGVVASVGTGVERLHEGDEVVAMAPGCFSRFVTTDARLVVAKPRNLGFPGAAGVPVVFLTARYALQHMARLRAGERVLVHSGAGGVGLAAVQVAQRAGAEVFATAGSDEKREYLRSRGVHHVFDSRSLDFEAGIRTATGGAGVDVVLNALAGEYIPRSLSLLAPGGRFVEIGKIGTWTPEQMAEARPDVRYFILALDTLVLEQTDEVAANLSALMDDFAAGALEPLPQTVFPLPKAKAAFRYMAQARHIGKVVLDDTATKDGSVALRDDATYLITGGRGGLGLCLAQWLVAQGARSLVLVGRSEPGPEAADAVAALRMRGAQVLSLCADVSRESDVRAVVARIGEGLPPLRGVFHAAGVLDDGILVNQDWDRFERVMAPKLLGALHLHAATAGTELDFFVMFSSSAALLGFPGQGNYAAANSFLDAFAHYRQAQGLPAQSVNWGPWDEVGMTVGLKRQWSSLGMNTIKTDQGLDTLGVLLREKAPQVAVLPMDWADIARRFPSGEAPRLISGLTREFAATLEPTAEWVRLRQRVAEAPSAERKRIVVERLMEMGRAVLGLQGTQSMEAKAPLNEMGFDSLMAVELANELGRSAGIAVPVTLLFDYPTFDALAEYLLTDVLHLGAPARATAVEEGPAVARTAQELVDSVSALTDADVARVMVGRPDAQP